MKPRKYTKEILERAVKDSTSVMGVLRLLGLRPAGGTHAHIVRRLRDYGIDTSHFLGSASNQGASHRGGPNKKSAAEILVLRKSGARQVAVRLRRALVEIGRPYSCQVCGLMGEWEGKPLKLQVNHRNRDWLDDRPENLEFLCPNCHSQTKGWCGSKGGTDLFDDARQARNRRRHKRHVAER